MTAWRVSVLVEGIWESRTIPKPTRPTREDAIQIGYNVDGMRGRDTPHRVEAVRIIRIEEAVEETIPMPWSPSESEG